MVAGKNIGLANNIRRVIENLSPKTKYMYLFQHDLPLIKEINHTDILITAETNDKMRLVGFKGEHPIQNPCGDDIRSESGIFYRRFKKWTDRNHFARVDHYKNDIMPTVTSIFPEDNMHKPTRTIARILHLIIIKRERVIPTMNTQMPRKDTVSGYLIG